jgi:hypothetical protein
MVWQICNTTVYIDADNSDQQTNDWGYDNIISYTDSCSSLWLVKDATDINVIDETLQSVIIDYRLQQNYPNPFNPATIIKYQLPAGSHVTLKIYDLLGREVATLVNEERPTGSYEIEFSAIGGATNLSRGIHFYKLQAGAFVETKKMILLR